MSDYTLGKVEPISIMETKKEYAERVLREHEERAKKTMYEKLAQMAPPPSKAQEVERLLARVAELEAEVARNNQYQQTGESPIAVMKQIPNVCPECFFTLNVTYMDDRLRVRFRHDSNDRCSRSMTEFFRPVAAFVEFI